MYKNLCKKFVYLNCTILERKIIPSRANPWTLKKISRVNLLVEVDNKKRAENLIEMQILHNLKCKAYPYVTFWFGLVLWHINRCRLFNAKSIFIHINSFISTYSV